jgi:uncharacterized protein (DUF58 family)
MGARAIYPTRRAIFLVALGIPVSLLTGILAPGLWTAGLAWLLFAALLIGLDIALAASGAKLRVEPELPGSFAMGTPGEGRFALAFSGSAPASAQLTLDTSEILQAGPRRLETRFSGGVAAGIFALTPLRRGEARLERLWIRWNGPLGLAWIQRVQELGRAVPVIPDVHSVKQIAIRLFQRDARAGLHVQLDAGAGGEFQALKDFQSGMDRRLIDWKQSARHGDLLVKEFRVEQNQHIVIALDTGRLMSAPLAGQPRLDRALHAALLLAYVGLRLGDRVGLFTFDERARLRSGMVSGIAAFPALQRLAAKIDYSEAETNFTLGLTQLSGDLSQRSIIVIFTDFSDTTSAELMLENAARLLKRHTLLFIVFRDEELETIRRHKPQTPHDATASVVADNLLREREIVVGRLRQMGARIVDVPLAQISTGLVDAYFAVKRPGGF